MLCYVMLFGGRVIAEYLVPRLSHTHLMLLHRKPKPVNGVGLDIMYPLSYQMSAMTFVEGQAHVGSVRTLPVDFRLYRGLPTSQRPDISASRYVFWL